MPPQVQTLDQLMAATQSVFDPQRQFIQQQMTSTQQGGQAQEEALMGQQRQAFGDISQMASNRGMLFSGFTPDQQAKYNANTFMPAMVGLKEKIAGNIANLQGNLLTLDSDQRQQAMQMQQGQQDKLFSWQQQQEERAWQQQQAEVAYQREMEKLRQEQAFARSQAAAQTSAQNAQGSAAKAAYGKAVQETRSFLDKYKGRDGFVSPKTYQDARRAWTAKGQDPTLFDSLYGGWANTNWNPSAYGF